MKFTLLRLGPLRTRMSRRSENILSLNSSKASSSHCHETNLKGYTTSSKDRQKLMSPRESQTTIPQTNSGEFEIKCWVRKSCFDGDMPDVRNQKVKDTVASASQSSCFANRHLKRSRNLGNICESLDLLFRKFDGLSRTVTEFSNSFPQPSQITPSRFPKRSAV